MSVSEHNENKLHINYVLAKMVFPSILHAYNLSTEGIGFEFRYQI